MANYNREKIEDYIKQLDEAIDLAQELHDISADHVRHQKEMNRYTEVYAQLMDKNLKSSKLEDLLAERKLQRDKQAAAIAQENNKQLRELLVLQDRERKAQEKEREAQKKEREERAQEREKEAKANEKERKAKEKEERQSLSWNNLSSNLTSAYNSSRNDRLRLNAARDARSQNLHGANAQKFVSDRMDTAANKFNIGATAIDASVKLFSEAVKTFSNLAMQGLNRQASQYNENFQNISVRTGMSRGTYLNNQMGLAGLGRSRLSNFNGMDLFNNIKSSDVMNMWNTMASSGLDVNKMVGSGTDIANVLMTNVVPYLNTMSDTMLTLDNRFGDNYVLKFAGIDRATKDIVGSSRFISSNLDSMLDLVQPISQLANEDLAIQTAKSSGMMEQLMKSGWSQSQAESYFRKNANMINNPRKFQQFF